MVSARSAAKRLALSAVEGLVVCAISDHIDASRNPECKLPIGYSPIFLQVVEDERRFAPFPVAGRQGAHLEGWGVDAYHQVLVIRLAATGRQLQGKRAGDRRIGVTRRKIPDDVPFAREEERRRGRLIVGRDVADDHLLVLRNVRIDLHAVRDELLLLGGRVGPVHPAWLLHEDLTALLCLRLQDAAAVVVDEVGGEVLDALVTLLKRSGERLGGRLLLCIRGRRRGADGERDQE